MNDEESPAKTALPLLLLIGLVVGGAVLQFRPYESARPETRRSGQLNRAPGAVDAFAHLWEDPFRAVVRSTAVPWDPAMPQGELLASRPVEIQPDSTVHAGASVGSWSNAKALAGEVERLLRQRRPEGPNTSVCILPVLVNGGVSLEESEVRRRERHAVLSGLSCQGYEPQSGTGLGVLRTHWISIEDPFEAGVRRTLFVDEEESGSVASTPLYTPYEWFEAGSNPVAEAGDPPGYVLVLWVDAPFFRGEILEGLDFMLGDVLERLPTWITDRIREIPAGGVGNGRVPVSVTVLGPADSETLKAMNFDFVAREEVMGSQPTPQQVAAGGFANSPRPSNRELEPFVDAFLGRLAVVVQEETEVFEFLEEGRQPEELSKSRQRKIRDAGQMAFDQIREKQLSLRHSILNAINPKRLPYDLELDDVATFVSHLLGPGQEELTERVLEAVDGYWIVESDLEPLVTKMVSDLSAHVLREEPLPAPWLIEESLARALEGVQLGIWVASRGINPQFGHATSSSEAIAELVNGLSQRLFRSLPENWSEGWEERAPIEINRVRTSTDRKIAQVLARSVEGVTSQLPYLDLLARLDVIQDDLIVVMRSALEELQDRKLDHLKSEVSETTESESDTPDWNQHSRGVFEAYCRWLLAEARLVSTTDLMEGLEGPERGVDTMQRIEALLGELPAAFAPATSAEVAAVTLLRNSSSMTDSSKFGVWRTSVLSELELGLLRSMIFEDSSSQAVADFSANLVEDFEAAVRQEILDGCPPPLHVLRRRAPSALSSFIQSDELGLDPRNRKLETLPEFLVESDPTFALGMDPPMSVRQFLRELFNSALLRREAVRNHLGYDPDERRGLSSVSVGEQVLFEIARWEYKVSEAAAKSLSGSEDADTRSIVDALAVQFFLEQRLDGGIPEGLDRLKLLGGIRRELRSHGDQSTLSDRDLYPNQAKVGGSRRSRQLDERLASTVEDHFRSSGAKFSSAEIVSAIERWTQIDSSGSTLEFLSYRKSRNDVRAGARQMTGFGVRLARDREKAHFYPGDVLAHATFLNSRATAGDMQSIPGELRQVGNPRYRDIVLGDEVVLGELGKELLRRGVSPGFPDEVALVTEWDTPFGRKLPGMFLEVARNLSEESPSRHFYPDRITVYQYMRGLDGRPSLEDPIQPEQVLRAISSEVGGNGAKVDAEAKTTGLERAFGTSQFDYVRRLVAKLEEHDRVLRMKGQRLRAVGVLGSDVYDKLLIMRALREALPNVQYFTTDIDARLANPGVYAWTRNLLVGSSFGLELHERFQREIAPFRDSYQTASFVAAQLAVGASELRVEMDRVRQPRLFEIGRGGPYDISIQGRFPDDVGLHPPRRPDRPTGRTVALVGTFALLMILTANATGIIRRRLSLEATLKSWQARPWMIGMIWFGAVLLVIAVYLENQTDTPEPFVFFEGISVWPTILCRLAIIILAIRFLLHSVGSLEGNRVNVEQRFFSDRENEESAWAQGVVPAASGGHYQSDDSPPSPRSSASMARLARSRIPQLATRYLAERRAVSIRGWGDLDQAASRPIQPGSLWDEYMHRAAVRARLLRVIPMVVCFFLLGLVLHELEPWRYAPSRGWVAGFLESLTFWLAITLTIFLTCAVIDTTRLFHRFVRLLAQNSTEWTNSVREWFETEDSLGRERVDDYIDLRLIAERSKGILRLIVLPFVLLTLLIIGRNRLFDAWIWNAPLILTGAILFSSAIWAAVSVRKAAEEARDTAKSRIEKRLLELKKCGSDEVVHLELLLVRVASLGQGAFAPYRSSPVMRALLLPFGGMGLVSVVEAVRTVGF